MIQNVNATICKSIAEAVGRKFIQDLECNICNIAQREQGIRIVPESQENLTQVFLRFRLPEQDAIAAAAGAAKTLFGRLLKLYPYVSILK